ncbi:hypothetical protein [Nostoc sp. LEGE 12450]|nr:hypothetical protein [Nostoc sp. LEGE 12450]MBE8990153.1 hypothetical protein [Nostoc sp. LEGE 12450]
MRAYFNLNAYTSRFYPNVGKPIYADIKERSQAQPSKEVAQYWRLKAL